MITPEKNLWHCLGACQAGGDPIDWVMRANGVSFRHAVELLRADSALAAGVGVPVKLPAPVAPSASHGELLNQVVGFYHQSLLESPEALAYLGKRGLGDPELIARFRLGYANRTLGYRLPAKNVKAGADIKGRLQRIGILRASGHEHFNGSIVVPVIDDRIQQGELLRLLGRFDEAVAVLQNVRADRHQALRAVRIEQLARGGDMQVRMLSPPTW